MVKLWLILLPGWSLIWASGVCILSRNSHFTHLYFKPASTPDVTVSPTCSPHPDNFFFFFFLFNPRAQELSDAVGYGARVVVEVCVCVCERERDTHTRQHISVTWGTKSQESKKSSGQGGKKTERKKNTPHQKERGQQSAEMKTSHSQSQPAPRGAASSLQSLSSSAMSPLSTASISLTALLILSIPVCNSKSSCTLVFFLFFLLCLLAGETL